MAVFLVLFMGGAATHMTIFLRNKARGHFFAFNAMLFGFCMARITTSILRIASISLPTDIPLLIAAQIFTAAGVILIFLINLLFTHRIIRAQHPHLGWHPLLSHLFNFAYFLIVATLIFLITAVIQSFYTLSPSIHAIDRTMQLTGLTIYATIAFLPLPLLLLSNTIPRTSPVDKFGTQGRLRHAIAIVAAGTTIIALGAAYRAGTAYLAPVPRTKGLPWYFSRAAFYVFNFGLEILVVYFYALVRIDQRFHVPDGAKGPGSYAVGRRDGAQQEQLSRESVETDGHTRAGGASMGSVKSEERDVEKGASLDRERV